MPSAGTRERGLLGADAEIEHRSWGFRQGFQYRLIVSEVVVASAAMAIDEASRRLVRALCTPDRVKTRRGRRFVGRLGCHVGACS